LKPGVRTSWIALNGDVRSTWKRAPSRSSMAVTASSWRRHASAQMIAKPHAMAGDLRRDHRERAGRHGAQQRRPQPVEQRASRVQLGQDSLEAGGGERLGDRGVGLAPEAWDQDGTRRWSTPLDAAAGPPAIR